MQYPVTTSKLMVLGGHSAMTYGRTLLLVLSLVVAGIVMWRPGTGNSVDEATVALLGVDSTHDRQVGPRTEAIETVRLGMRVRGRNPLFTDRERASWQEPDFSSWRAVSLTMRKSNGGQLDVRLLRPASWLARQNAEVGSTVELDLPEMGASGPALVTVIEDAPPIEERAEIDGGSVVTGRFAHTSGADEQLVSLHVEDGNEPITGTSNHPFWSEDRQAFVEAGELKPGERVRTAHVGVVRVTKTERGPPASRRVYNLEVYGEHVYWVGSQGVLVHNNCHLVPLTAGDDGVVVAGRVIVRRFDSKQKIKRAKKHGIAIDPNMAPDRTPAIPTTTTSIDPVNPNTIRKLTAAQRIEAFIDIDVTGKRLLVTKTKAGVTEIRVLDDIDASDIVNSGRVRKSRLSTED